MSSSLVLRPVRADDAEAIWSIHSDPDTNLYNPAGPMTDRYEATQVAQTWANDCETDGVGYWAVAENTAPDVVVGIGGMRKARWQERDIYNLYYRLSPSVWRRGYAGQIVQATVELWRSLPDPPPLIARTTAENIPSQRTAERGGLVRRPDLDDPSADRNGIVYALERSGKTVDDNVERSREE